MAHIVSSSHLCPSLAGPQSAQTCMETGVDNNPSQDPHTAAASSIPTAKATKPQLYLDSGHFRCHSIQGNESAQPAILPQDPHAPSSPAQPRKTQAQEQAGSQQAGAGGRRAAATVPAETCPQEVRAHEPAAAATRRTAVTRLSHASFSCAHSRRASVRRASISSASPSRASGGSASCRPAGGCHACRGPEGPVSKGSSTLLKRMAAQVRAVEFCGAGLWRACFLGGGVS